MSSNEVWRKVNVQTARGAGFRGLELWKASLNDEFRTVNA